MDSYQTDRLVLAGLMLAGAAALDLKWRRVPNRYWIPFATLALGYDVLAAVADPPAVAVPFLFAAVFSGLFWVMFRARLYGGADAKGLMTLAWLAPFAPVGLAAEPVSASGPVLSVGLPPVLDAVTNGTLLVLAFPIVLLFANLARGRTAFPAVFLGMPMRLEAARARHVWPMHRVVDGKVTWRYWQRAGGDLEATYADLDAAGQGEVWATPKVPLLAFILLGYLVALWQGNLAVRLALALQA